MPETAVKPVGGGVDIIFPAVPGERRHDADHLSQAQTPLRDKLIVAHAGVGVAHSHDPVEDVLAVFPAVEGKVEFAQFVRHRGNGSLNIGSRTHRQMTGQAGPYGAIEMMSDSEITIKNNATMYVSLLRVRTISKL